MTAIISKPEQKRLDSCDMARPKWAEFHEQRGTCGCDAFKIDELAPNDAVRVENARQNGQAQGNTKLLGKYRLKYHAPKSGRFLRLVAGIFETSSAITD